MGFEDDLDEYEIDNSGAPYVFSYLRSKLIKNLDSELCTFIKPITDGESFNSVSE